MKKWLAALLALVMLVSLCAACGGSGPETTAAAEEETEAAADETEAAAEAGGELNLFTWDAMFPQELLDGFTEETGIKINYSNFDFDEDMLAKLEETQGGDYDLVIADDYIIELAIRENLVQKLDTAKLANYGNINPLFQGYFYDPADEYTVPIGAGVPLIVYDPALTGFELTSYSDLWDARLEDNVALIANYRVVDGIALKTLGASFNTEDLDEIAAAGEKLVQLAPNIRLINDSNTQDFVVSGEVAAAFIYTSQVTAALLARPDLAVCYPSEGLGFGIMGAFIPSQAPNAAAAYAFLDYLLDAEHGAAWSEYMGYYCCNKAAEEFISDEMRPMVVLPEDTERGEIIQNVGPEAEEAFANIFRTFQEACD